MMAGAKLPDMQIDDFIALAAKHGADLALQPGILGPVAHSGASAHLFRQHAPTDSGVSAHL
jgi:hypothetical protein